MTATDNNQLAQTGPERQAGTEKVGIIVLSYNQAQLTVNCLESLTKISYPNFEITVVDNASQDQSVSLIRERFPDVCLIANEINIGFARANNMAVRRVLQTDAKYVWFLNNDTVVDPDALTHLVEAARRDHRIGAVAGVAFFMDHPDRVQVWGGGSVNRWLGVSHHFDRPVDEQRIDYLCGVSLLMPRAAVEDIKGFSENFFVYWEDADLSFRLTQAGWKLAVAPQSRIWHKVSAALGPTSPVLDRYFNASAVIFMRRHAPVPAIPIVVGALGRAMTRVKLRRWPNVRAVFAGTLDGLNGRVGHSPR